MKTKQDLEILKQQAYDKFQDIRGTWVQLLRWAQPHRMKWMLAHTEGQRNNFHIVDTTHILALRSFVAGFLEGNTSASRMWFRWSSGNRELDLQPEVHKWLDLYTTRTHRFLNLSNFYHEAGQFYYDYGSINTGTHFIEEIDQRTFFFHTLTPGSYYIINNGRGEACVLVREFVLNIKAVVSQYGYENCSAFVQKMYDDSNYKQYVEITVVCQENEDFDPDLPVGGENRQWICQTYESGLGKGDYVANTTVEVPDNIMNNKKFLRVSYSKRKPFIVGRSRSNMQYEYGETGPTLDAIGLIKSLNKKAISKDRALEQMINPSVQGPASLKKTYVTTAPNKYIPLDPTSAAKGGLRQVFEISPAIGAVIQDTGEMRKSVDDHYFADFLLFLSKNPKTRTATEAAAVVEERQSVIGPNLQSLNQTYNMPLVEFAGDFVLDNDPDLPPPPDALRGRFIRPEFVSVFAQVQRAADLPMIDRYTQMVLNVGQINPAMFDKANLDRLADLYEDRLYLPEGLNRGQEEVQVMREQAQAARQRQQEMEMLAQGAKAAKDVGLQVNQNQGEE